MYPLFLLALLFISSNCLAQDLWQEIREAVHNNHLTHPPMEQIPQDSLESLNAYLQQLDSYSRHIPADEVLKTKALQQGRTGIGVELYRKDNELLLMPFVGGPLYNSGIRERVHLLEVNGKKVRQLPTEAVAGILTGKVGSQLILKTASLDGNTTTVIRVTRQQFLPQTVEHITEGPLPYLRIRKFSARNTLSALLIGLKKLTEKGHLPIIDLRDAIGGDLHEAMDAASLFLAPEQVVARVEDNGGRRQTYYALPNQQLSSSSLILLIGPDTASAAEVFAAALQLNLRALLIGQRSYGKSSSQTLIPLSDGSMLKLSNLRILEPGDPSRAFQGVEPDIAVTTDTLLQTTALLKRTQKLVEKGVYLTCKADGFDRPDNLEARAKETGLAVIANHLRIGWLKKDYTNRSLYHLCLSPVFGEEEASDLVQHYRRQQGGNLFLVRLYK